MFSWRHINIKEYVYKIYTLCAQQCADGDMLTDMLPTLVTMSTQHILFGHMTHADGDMPTPRIMCT